LKTADKRQYSNYFSRCGPLRFADNSKKKLPPNGLSSSFYHKQSLAEYRTWQALQLIGLSLFNGNYKSCFAAFIN
jgi:hypothetical protein